MLPTLQVSAKSSTIYFKERYRCHDLRRSGEPFGRDFEAPDLCSWVPFSFVNVISLTACPESARTKGDKCYGYKLQEDSPG